MIHIEEEITLPLSAQFTSLYDTYADVKRCGYNYQTILIVILLSNNTETSVK